MTLFLYVLALSFPTLEGVLALRLLEGKTPVLFCLERWCIGFLLGFSSSAYLLFWAVFFGAPLTLAGFLTVHIFILSALFLCSLRLFPRLSFPASPALSLPTGQAGLPSFHTLKSTLPSWLFIGGCCIIIWTLFKIFFGGYELLSIPGYWNDIYASWNMRSKVFYFSQSLMLDVPSTHEFFFGGRVPGYPLAIPFTKVWLVLMTGGWSEMIVNSIHFLWFAALLVCLFCALLRLCSFVWSFLGVYLLVSLPLVLMHGTSAYADIYMAAHLFLVLTFFYQWMITRDAGRKRVWLLLLSFAAAAMLFVKNEALLIYLPPLLLLFVFSAKQISSHKERLRVLSKFAGIVALVAVPWVSFKISYGMVFGNATQVSGFSLTPHPQVPTEIMNDLLYTGSFLLFFPLMILLLALTWHFWSRRALGVIILFLVGVIVGEFFLYYLTPLAIEAIRHTGFGRGMVHLLPTFVFTAVLLLQHLFGNKYDLKS